MARRQDRRARTSEDSTVSGLVFDDVAFGMVGKDPREMAKGEIEALS
jgi:hypothetical protein